MAKRRTQQEIDESIRRAEDLIENHVVDKVRYSAHAPPKKTPSMKVTYECGANSFHEWVTIGYPGYPGVKAANWWMKRAPGDNPPATVDDALARSADLTSPHSIRVSRAGKYPEIIHHTLPSSVAT